MLSFHSKDDSVVRTPLVYRTASVQNAWTLGRIVSSVARRRFKRLSWVEMYVSPFHLTVSGVAKICYDFVNVVI
jgi:hypothetical protein